MKPKRLEFCGINSFSEKAVIDFDRLLAGGIFGIFGDTGSGKTTILDSMIFALYGRVDRIRGGNANEIINYHCDKAYVIFDFECEWNGKRRLFRVERQIKRKNSQQELELCELEGDSVRSVSEGVKKTNEKILEIIGLSFEDFKKCIALPQGEFAQFVKADRGERLRLISRLFDLEGYGEKLNAVLKDRFDSAKQELDLKDGELNAYASYSEEALSELKGELSLLASRKCELDAEYERKRAEFEMQKNCYERTQKLEKYRAEQEKEETQRSVFEEKRAALKRLPAAKEIADIQTRILASHQTVCEGRKEIAKLSESRKQSGDELAKIKEAIGKADFENAIADIKAARKNLELIAADAKELAELKQKRGALAAEYKAAEKERLEGEKRLFEADKMCKAAEEKVAKYEYADPAAFLRENFESALLREEYSASLDYFSEKLDALHSSGEERGTLYAAVEKELIGRIGHYRALSGGEKVSDVAELLEKFRKEQARFAALRDERHKAELAKEKAVSALRKAQDEAERIAQRGGEMKEKIGSLSEKIANALGGDAARDVAAYAAKLESEEKNLIDKRESLRAKETSLQAALSECEKNIARKEAETVSAERAEQSDLILLSEKLAESGFEDEKQARELLLRYPDRGALEKEIGAYDERVRGIHAAIRELTGGAEFPAVGKEEFEAAEKAFNALTALREETGKSFAVFEKQVDEFGKKLAEKKKLERERKELDKKFGLIEKLRKLFYGNAFMEFVAGEYLSDISRSATETLLKLTGGRYFIRYEQGFLVGDNFSGGELRSVNTLSGGETFLVSLSLALSLSSAIYTKSLRPIEFFFLDEGFGTLDEKLVDTVMDSLEKLKNTHFSIGLISHVEELKHRIDSKITVLSATESGGSSKIKISC